MKYLNMARLFLLTFVAILGCANSVQEETQEILPDPIPTIQNQFQIFDQLNEKYLTDTSIENGNLDLALAALDEGRFYPDCYVNAGDVFNQSLQENEKEPNLLAASTAFWCYLASSIDGRSFRNFTKVNRDSAQVFGRRGNFSEFVGKLEDFFGGSFDETVGKLNRVRSMVAQHDNSLSQLLLSFHQLLLDRISNVYITLRASAQMTHEHSIPAELFNNFISETITLGSQDASIVQVHGATLFFLSVLFQHYFYIGPETLDDLLNKEVFTQSLNRRFLVRRDEAPPAESLAPLLEELLSALAQASDNILNAEPRWYGGFPEEEEDIRYLGSIARALKTSVLQRKFVSIPWKGHHVQVHVLKCLEGDAAKIKIEAFDYDHRRDKINLKNSFALQFLGKCIRL